MSRQLLIETSTRGGFTALIRNDTVEHVERLDTSRRHTRDLTTAVKRLFTETGSTPGELSRIVISLGPGSYTGLRVGLTAAKTLAYATGCDLIAVPTFHAFAESLATTVNEVEIVADALQGNIYVQQFERRDRWIALTDIHTHSLDHWTPTLSVAGPAARLLNGHSTIELDQPTPEGLWRAAQAFAPLSRAELFAVEPLYLRGSSAEELRKAQSVNAASASARVS